ncbi:MAG: tripartite tricarboxylate transporter substrate binding protein [Xanthobacteraceae bacterium]|nr:tripartite tricarboxylate transporter substrate binding protein [Xanthobacteraceae bacterium]
MKSVRTLLAAAALAAAAALLAAGPLSAQAWPTRQPLKIIVPFPPGGPTDGMARIISDRLGAVLGQTIVIENRGGGAGGSVGAKAVASAEPDGYTMLMTPGGSLTSGPAVHRNIGYDPLKVFAPVGQLIVTHQFICVHPDVPAKTLPELIAYAKANPGKISFGTQGFGTGTHLLNELLKIEAGINIVHVPYRGTGPMLAALVAGEVQMAIDPSTTVLPHIQSGKLRPLAVVTNERSPKLPDVPTTAELGYPKLNSPFWLGVVVPAGTPPEIIGKLNAAFRQALNDPATRQRLDMLGAEIRIDTPETFGKMIESQLALWRNVVETAGIKAE